MHGFNQHSCGKFDVCQSHARQHSDHCPALRLSDLAFLLALQLGIFSQFCRVVAFGHLACITLAGSCGSGACQCFEAKPFAAWHFLSALQGSSIRAFGMHHSSGFLWEWCMPVL
jgi:hypothetical protein